MRRLRLLTATFLVALCSSGRAFAQAPSGARGSASTAPPSFRADHDRGAPHSTNAVCVTARDGTVRCAHSTPRRRFVGRLEIASGFGIAVGGLFLIAAGVLANGPPLLCGFDYGGGESSSDCVPQGGGGGLIGGGVLVTLSGMALVGVGSARLHERNAFRRWLRAHGGAIAPASSLRAGDRNFALTFHARF